MSMSEYYEIYIAPDEEVTTVIGRIRHAQQQRVALVIPQHAAVLQSLINLRLLVREAKKYDKELLIVTQDEAGAALAQRIGVDIVSLSTWQKEYAQHDHDDHPEKPPQSQKEQIGSQQFSTPMAQDKPTVDQDHTPSSQQSHSDLHDRQHIPSTKPRPSSDGIKRPRVSQHRMDIAPTPQQKPHRQTHQQQEYIPSEETSDTQVAVRADETGASAEAQHHDDAMPQARQQRQTPGIVAVIAKNLRTLWKRIAGWRMKDHHQESQYIEIKDHGLPKKIITIFGLVIALIVSMIFLPYTIIHLHVDDINLEAQLKITADEQADSVDRDRRIIPARKIEKDITQVVDITPTGATTSEAQKAQGTITIVNTYSSAPQPLVATTRFLAENGVLFRLVHPVTVPGTTQQDGATVPGKIDALVVADKAGEEGNIEPTKFSIPGFAGTPKETKIFATSKDAMSGGNTKGRGIQIITQKDIDDAKKASEASRDEFVRAQIEKLLRPEEKLLPDAITYNVIAAQPTAAEGSAQKNPEYRTQLHVQALVFKQDDVRQIARETLAQKASHDLSDEMITLTYQQSDALYDEGKLMINAKATYQQTGTLDTKDFRQKIAGLNHQQLTEVIEKNYPLVSQITMQSVPSMPGFIANHISTRPWMTKIIIEDE